MNGVTTLVFSDLFKREKKMYSFNDWKLLVPMSFQMLLNFCLSMLLWTVPVLMVWKMGAVGSWYSMIITFGPPIGFTALVSKPNVIFNNKNFYRWLFCNIRYAFMPKYYADGKPCKINNGDHVKCDFVIWLGDEEYDDYWASGGRKGRRNRRMGGRK